MFSKFCLCDTLWQIKLNTWSHYSNFNANNTNTTQNKIWQINSIMYFIFFVYIQTSLYRSGREVEIWIAQSRCMWLGSQSLCRLCTLKFRSEEELDVYNITCTYRHRVSRLLVFCCSVTTSVELTAEIRDCIKTTNVGKDAKLYDLHFRKIKSLHSFHSFFYWSKKCN